MAIMPALVGCGSMGASSQVRSASDEAGRDAEITALRVQLDEQEQELRVLRESQIQAALAEQRTHGGLIGQALVDTAWFERTLKRGVRFTPG